MKEHQKLMQTKFSHEKRTVMVERVITKKEPSVEQLHKKHTETNKVIYRKNIVPKKEVLYKKLMTSNNAAIKKES